MAVICYSETLKFVTLCEKAQPEDGDKKVNEHDGGDESVDQEQSHCQRRLSWAAWSVWLSQCVIGAIFDLACSDNTRQEQKFAVHKYRQQ